MKLKQAEEVRMEQLKQKMIINAKKRIVRIRPGVNCDIKTTFLDPRSVKISKNLDIYLDKKR